jgi:hypothetical protein
MPDYDAYKLAYPPHWDDEEEITLKEREAIEADRAERASEARAEWKAQQNGY